MSLLLLSGATVLESDYSIGVTFILALFYILVSCHELSAFSVFCIGYGTNINMKVFNHTPLFISSTSVLWAKVSIGLDSFRSKWHSEPVKWHAEKTLMPKSVIAILLEDLISLICSLYFLKFKKCHLYSHCYNTFAHASHLFMCTMLLYCAVKEHFLLFI